MNGFSTQVQAWIDLGASQLWRATWQAAVVLAAVWIFTRCYKSLSPRVACWIWRLTCLKLLLLLVWVEPLALPLLPAPRHDSVPSHSAPATVDISQAVDVPVMPSNVAAGDATAPLDLAYTQATPRARSLRTMVFCLWLVGVLGGTFITARRLTGVARLRADSVPTTDARLTAILREQALRLGIVRLPELRLSSSLFGPALVGVLRPTILLPANTKRLFSPNELGVILAHELAHLKRHDLIWNWLLAVVRNVFFFHPLVWLAARGWSEAQESACDEMVIRSGLATASDCGRLLVKLSASPPNLHAVFSAAGVRGAYRHLERRIILMARVRPFSIRHTRTVGGLLALVGLMGLVPWQLVAKDAQEAGDDPAASAFASEDQPPLRRLLRDT